MSSFFLLFFNLIYGIFTIYMAATQIYHSKITLVHIETEQAAIAELKVWRVPIDDNFPEGIKYSLFLVSLENKQVIVGFDNHKPKGHHFHHHVSENSYEFESVDKLIDDFWALSEKEGYKI